MSLPAFGLHLSLVAFCAVAARAQEMSGQPTFILTGGRVFTADSSRPWAEAVAIRGARILAVGTNADVAKLATPATRRIDVAGRVIVPGFNDAHAHLGCVLDFVTPVVVGGERSRTTSSPGRTSRRRDHREATARRNARSGSHREWPHHVVVFVFEDVAVVDV